MREYLSIYLFIYKCNGERVNLGAPTWHCTGGS